MSNLRARSYDSSSAGDSKGFFPGEERVHEQLLQYRNELKCTLSEIFSHEAAQREELMRLKKEYKRLLKSEQELKENVLKLETEKLEKEPDVEHNKEKDEVLEALEEELNERDALLQGLLKTHRNADDNDDDDVREVTKDDDVSDADDDDAQEVTKEGNAEEVKKLQKELIEPSSKINRAAFKEALKQILFKKSMSAKWQQLSLDDPHWQPFRTVLIEGTDEHEEILDLANGRLSMLMHQLGDEADSILLAALTAAMNNHGQHLKRRRECY